MMGRGKSIIVVADTHFGLRNEIFFEPEVFSGFLSWVKRLEKGEVKPLKLGDWNGEKNEKVLKPPDKIILLGDILELWDASDRSVDVCIRSFTQPFSKLGCEKIYVHACIFGKFRYRAHNVIRPIDIFSLVCSLLLLLRHLLHKSDL